MNLFTTPEVRKDFIIGITEILAKIYKVKDPTLKRSIFDELVHLSDKELMVKKELVERYLEQSTQTTQSYFNKMKRAENEHTEREERKGISLTF